MVLGLVPSTKFAGKFKRGGGGGGGRGLPFGGTTGRGGRGRGKASYRGGHTGNAPDPGDDGPTELDHRFEEVERQDRIDDRMGFYRYQEGPEKLGWLVNMRGTLIKDAEWSTGRAAVDYYFIEEDGGTFKCTVLSDPYFFVACKQGTESDVEEYLRRKFERTISKVVRVQKDDLSMPNHLLGYQRTFLQLFFRNVPDLLQVRKILLPAAQKNKKKLDALDAYAEVVNAATYVNYENEPSVLKKNVNNALDCIVDIREYDVPYYLRVAIDNDIRVGLWYNVRASSGSITISRRPDLVKRADPVVLAFDIETTKLPLKFPDASIDHIMMISYMIDGEGFLITNRDIVSMDIEDFEYTPKPELEGSFTVFNEKDEEALLRRFMEHIQEVRPTVVVTYNGDFFDWPFVEARCVVHGINMEEEIGFSKDMQDEYKSATGIHMDAFRWVKRDSYLPQGSQGLKAVTTAKLGYNPMELDPELMTRYASEQPQILAQYSVSDAVATYYLYMKYVHPFIFSLCNIIPLSPDEVLRKGTGTLCEMLLMVETFKANIIMPNKHVDETGKMFEGHLLESETYVGGHVEALEAGVFRSDIPYSFRVEPEACQQLLDTLDDALEFSIVNEGKLSKSDIVNFDDVRGEIAALLENLRDNPMRQETPLIYHLDVAAMYPNIMLTNRLQPDSIINEAMCAACDFNQPGKTCDRKMTWSWRGQYSPATRSEYNMIRNQLETETFPSKKPGEPKRPWISLTHTEQDAAIASRLSEYARRVYKKTHETKIVEREDIVCQRENPFYVDTVRSFRDRRYEYKGLHKTWKKKADEATAASDAAAADEAKKMIVLYDSLQLAHKVILNSFYGYVMRKGSRWYSMEMAGIVCLTGAKIIQMARELVERLGRPLELDTDGIWCILPSSFPENFVFKLRNGKKFPLSYPCTILNHLVHGRFTNHQYSQLADPDTYEYETHSENSIYFEVDGPYRAMVLPSSKEEDKMLKKRYAVFNEDGSLAELKGFEVKRRGELKLIKIFQTQIFKVFLEGSSLQECYEAVAEVANRWLDVLYSKGANLEDEELFDLISENRSMSRALEDYGAQKSTSISTAKRLAEFLGDQMVKDKGLACKFIISSKPIGAPVTERAVPIAIFSAEPSVKKHFLRKWLKDNSQIDFDIRTLLDWNYYIERLASVIQKIITIPAAMQKVFNPVPRVRHPDWLLKRVAAKDDKFKQHRITDMFTKLPPGEKQQLDFGRTDDTLTNVNANIEDLEDFGQSSSSAPPGMKVPLLHKRSRKGKENGANGDDSDGDPDEGMPDMLVDYAGWINFQKRKWKRQKTARTKRRQLYGDRPNPIASEAGGVSSYFRRQTEALASRLWEVLQIDETDTPGEFRMWVVLDRQLYPVRLTIPRIFFVNLREEQPPNYVDTAVYVQKVVRQLPRGHTVRHLYECQMPEATYRDNVKTLSGFFRHRDVAGVYETKVPLLARALLDLGCVCSVANQTRGTLRKSMEEGFSMADLKSEGTTKSPYLEGKNAVNYLYLYHTNTDERHVFGLFSLTTARATVVVVDRGKNADQMPNLGRLYAERLADAIPQIGTDPGKNNGAFDYPETIDFSIEHVTTERDSARIVQRALSAYQDERRGPTMLIIHSARSAQNLAMSIRSINDFPRISMPSHKRDNTFPALDWQRPAARRMVAHFLNLREWITSRLALARYANVPVCNIQADAPVFLADIFFARRLQSQNCLLWWSPTEKPDLGGREEDENQNFVTELSNPEINNSGCYGNVCIEMEVVNLAVNTLLESTLINELEGSTGGIGFEAAAHTLDDHLKGKKQSDRPLANFGDVGDGDPRGSSVTFGLLKGMVKGWVAEYAETHNRHAEMMVEHFYRWLTSSASNMHDPVLHGIIHGLMRKVFMQLVAEFKKLGSQIVFGSFNKIIILTSKSSINNAFAYGSYILKAITAKPLYQMMELEAMHYWELLLWMDSANYGGVICPQLPGAANSQDQQQQQTVEMQWNIKEYLPVAVHRSFQVIIAEFIHELHKHLLQRRSGGIGGSNPVRGIPRGTTASQAVVGEDEAEFSKRLIGQTLTRKLLRMVPEIYKAQMGINGMTEEIRAAFAFPELPGSHLALSNPVLEFVKSVTEVLGLDKRVDREVRVLRRNLLDLIGTREFSEEAVFRNPCESFRLDRVICTYCNYCRDLDFCRDPDLMPVAVEGANGTVHRPIRPWQCPSCKTEYDRGAIEELLVGVVSRYLLSYQLQDLKCQKCRLVKQGNLADHCSCSGPFVTLISKEEFRRRIRVFLNIAKYHGLEFLQEVVTWAIQRC